MLILIIASIVAIIPVFFIKQYLISGNFNYLVLAMLSYLGLLISYLHIFKQKEVSKSYTILQVIQVLLVVIYGYLIGEKLNSKKIMGIVAGIISINLLI